MIDKANILSSGHHRSWKRSARSLGFLGVLLSLITACNDRPFTEAQTRKVTDSLILSIPGEYRTPSGVTFLPNEFDFFLPDYSGWTSQRLQNRYLAGPHVGYLKERPVNWVEVAYIWPLDPDARKAGALSRSRADVTAAMFKNSVNKDSYSDMYGLRCYQQQITIRDMVCIGPRGETPDDYIMLDLPESLPSNQGGFPLPSRMHAQYISRLYGGLTVSWYTDVRNLPRWREIDSQIWKFVREWNVAGKR